MHAGHELPRGRSHLDRLDAFVRLDHPLLYEGQHGGLGRGETFDLF
jgi:hypothetical protein